MKAITKFQFFDIVKSMKPIYEKEIGQPVPKFEVLTKKELFPIDITTVYECELYTINICKKHYYLGENHFKAMLFHEFTHLRDYQNGARLGILKENLHAFSEIHAGYIEMIALLNTIDKRTLSVNDTFQLLGHTNTITEYLNEMLLETTKEGDILHQVKSMQYLLGTIKRVEEVCEDFNPDYYLSKLSNKYGSTAIELYNFLKSPIEFSEENVNECFRLFNIILDYVEYFKV